MVTVEMNGVLKLAVVRLTVDYTAFLKDAPAPDAKLSPLFLVDRASFIRRVILAAACEQLNEANAREHAGDTGIVQMQLDLDAAAKKLESLKLAKADFKEI